MEGYVAWLPIAFVLLLVTVLGGKRAIFPWMTNPPTIPEKALWLEPTFFSAGFGMCVDRFGTPWMIVAPDPNQAS